MALEAKTQAFVEALAAKGGPPLYTLTPQAARKVLLDLQSQGGAKPEAAIEDRILQTTAGDVSVRIVRPVGASRMLPAVLYLHGGGWILGDATTHDRLIRTLARDADVAVVFVNYPPSPEAHYPTALEQALGAASYVQANGKELNLDGARLAIAGDSVGGGLAAAATILAKERGGPRFVHQLLFYPVTDASFDTPSYQQFADGPWLTRAAMKWFWDAYLPDKSARAQPGASPLRASREQLTGLPPALVITDANDVLRDEGEAYATKLMEAGVDVVATRYLGTIHDFMMLNALAETPAVRGAIAQAVDTLRRAFAPTARPAQVTMLPEAGEKAPRTP
ncbi:alpha/beta hydrolase [bacterium]|nr:alpha/beta hydrolase [bacterium]